MSSNKLATTGVHERRLRLIYELLDSGNNRKALVDIEKFLRKSPEFHQANVVKALILIRMRKEEEAREILKEVLRKAEAEGFALGDTTHVLLTCYKELNQPQMISAILEQLCANTKSEELMTQYFMSLVRTHEFLKMHQTALNMYKTFHNAGYFSWAIAGLVLHHEGFIGPLDQTATLSFQLAERMIDKFLMDEKIKNPEFEDTRNLLDLYSRLMLRQSTNWKKILNILKCKGYPPQELSAWNWNSDHESYCLVMELDGRSKELFSYLKDLFMEHKQYSLLKQIVDMFGKDENMRDNAIEFMDDLRENHASFVVALGDIYFATQDAERYDEDKWKEKIEEDLQMAIQFGIVKQNFFPDVVEHFKLVDKKTQCELLGIMAPNSIPMEDPEVVHFTMSTKDLIKDVNYELTRRDVMGRVFDLQQRVEQANCCFGKYLRLKQQAENKRISTKHLPSPDDDEIDYLDQYVLIAASILLSEHFKFEKTEAATRKDLMKLYGRKRSQETFPEEELLIWSAICILEYCLVKSPLNCTVRFMLANAYARLGATLEMLRIMQEINIKHIQLDSLGYLMYPLVLTTGTYSEALMLHRQANAMYSTYNGESTDYVVLAYDNCNFQQVLEFSTFRDQILQSSQCGLVLAETRLLEFMTCTVSMEALKDCAAQVLNEVNLEEMTKMAGYDTRDLTVMHNLFDDEVNWQTFKEATAKIDAHWLRVRLCLLTIITKLVTIGLNSESPEVIYNAELFELEKLVKTWDELCDNWKEVMTCEQPVETAFYGVYPPAHARYFDLSIPCNLMKQMKHVMEIVKEIHPTSAADHLKTLQETMGQDAQKLQKVLEENFKAFQKNPNCTMIGDCIRDFHFVVEFFSFFKILLAVAVSTIRTTQTQKTKETSKEKKGKFVRELAVIIKSNLDSFQKLHKLFCDFIYFLKNRPLPAWPDSTSTDKVSNETSFLLEAFPSYFNAAQKNVRNSHLDQLLGMARAVESMIQFIRNIEWQK